MKTVFTFLVVCVSLAATAQTKLIFHKSHSGKNGTFRSAVEGNLFGIHTSNFGIVEKQLVKLDSVISLGDDKVLLVFHSFSFHTAQPNIERMKDTKNWALGKTTVTKHHLFSRVHSLDSVKKQLINSKDYLEVDKTVFIGFDNKNSKAKNK